MSTDPHTFANMSASDALLVLRQQCNLYEYLPRLGDVSVTSISMGGSRRMTEAQLLAEDFANGSETYLDVPAKFAQRVINGDDDARQQLERVMRAEGN